MTKDNKEKIMEILKISPYDSDEWIEKIPDQAFRNNLTYFFFSLPSFELKKIEETIYWAESLLAGGDAFEWRHHCLTEISRLAKEALKDRNELPSLTSVTE